jgi:hypothetical protein
MDTPALLPAEEMRTTTREALARFEVVEGARLYG